MISTKLVTGKSALRVIPLIGLGLSAASLPWSVKMNGAFLIIFATISFFSLRRIQIANIRRHELILISSSCLYYLLYIPALLYTENLSEGLFHLEKKWTFFLLPFCVFLACQRSHKFRTIIFIFLTVSLMIACVVCLFIAAKINYLENVANDYSIFSINYWYFSYKLLAKNIGIHPAYLSWYVATTLIFLISIFFKINNQRNRITLSLLIGFLFCFTLLLASRAVLTATMIVIAAQTIPWLLKRNNWKYIYVAALILLISGFLIVKNDIIKGRLLSFTELVSDEPSKWGTFHARFKEWKASLELIRSNPVWGVGPGDLMDELLKVYRQRGWMDFVEAEYNSHNQLIQTTAGLGLPGIVCLICIIAISIYRSIKKKDVLYMGFLFVSLCFSMTESTLEVQKGIVFFNLFNSLLFFTSPANESGDIKQEGPKKTTR